jgi:cell division transport system permease protein
MILLHFKRAVRDMLRHRLLNLVTVVTVALTILIAGAIGVFILNIGHFLDNWKQGIRITAYLEEDPGEEARAVMEERIRGIAGVDAVTFVSKEDALEKLKDDMSRQASIFEHLEENPLPDAFEIRISADTHAWERIEALARQMESIEGIADVEFGQYWIRRFVHIFTLFQLSAYAMIGLLVLASMFIVGNTIRLIYYGRREEVEIMRLVGATNAFILTPFYIQSTLQGLIGGMVGIGAAYSLFSFLVSKVEAAEWMTIRFLPMNIIVMIYVASMLLGGLGCHISLKQPFKP